VWIKENLVLVLGDGCKIDNLVKLDNSKLVVLHYGGTGGLAGSVTLGDIIGGSASIKIMPH
jgi:hypothetical protein